MPQPDRCSEGRSQTIGDVVAYFAAPSVRRPAWSAHNWTAWTDERELPSADLLRRHASCSSMGDEPRRCGMGQQIKAVDPEIAEMLEFYGAAARRSDVFYQAAAESDASVRGNRAN